MSTTVSSNVHFDAESRFEVTGYAGDANRCEPFVSLRSATMTMILRDHTAIKALHAALDEASTKLTEARVLAAEKRAAS